MPRKLTLYPPDFTGHFAGLAQAGRNDADLLVNVGGQPVELHRFEDVGDVRALDLHETSDARRRPRIRQRHAWAGARTIIFTSIGVANEGGNPGCPAAPIRFAPAPPGNAAVGHRSDRPSGAREKHLWSAMPGFAASGHGFGWVSTGDGTSRA